MKEGTQRWILLGSFTLLLAALAVVLMLLKSGMPKLSAAEPRIEVTPEPKTEEDAVRMRTPIPTPVRPVETPRPIYPEKAVNLLVNGSPLFAVDSREAAEQLVRLYLNECAYENLDANAVLLTASVDAEISTVPADGSAEYLAFDAALNKLRKNRSLIPVRRTVERVAVLIETPAPQSTRSAQLFFGTRLFRHCGVASRTLVFTETLYKDGLAVSETETLNTPVLTGVAQNLLIGAYTVGTDMTEPDPSEGVRGPATSLSFQAPIRGTLVGYFGLATGEARYGVDYTAFPDTRVVAPEAGTVVFLGERPGYGYIIEIRHEEGFTSRLSFNATPNLTDLVLGKHVQKGSTLATLNPLEDASECVLHYELLIDGVPYNPLFYLP